MLPGSSCIDCEETMNFDGIIFDLDGTLWNCSSASAEAFNQVYEEYRLEKRVSEEFVQSISGKPSSECDEILLEGVPDDLKEEVSKRFDECEIAAIRKHASSSLYEGAHDGLLVLKPHYRLFVVSNCGADYLEIFLRCTSVGSLFDDYECHGRTKKSKSDNIRLLIERQTLNSPCCVGDTAGDEDAARKADVSFFFAKYGFGSAQQGLETFRNFDELTGFFLAPLNV